MRAVCRTGPSAVALRDIAVPRATPEHVVVRISACGINAGDLAWLAGLFPEIPASLHDICGATASGVVTETGAGVPRDTLGRKIAIYRSLKASSDCLGLWSDFARIHILNGVLLPDDVDEVDYAASLVSVVTAYAFLEQVLQAGHKAVVCSAGTSATGRSLLGICQARKIPVVSIVRSQMGAAALGKLGATDVLVSSDADFESELQRRCAALGATAVFDGVGGALIGRIGQTLPPHATIYCYGFLSGGEPLHFHSSLLLLKDLTLTSFSVLRPLARDTEILQRLLAGVREIIALPHCRTVMGRTFALDAAADALKWQNLDGSKTIFRP